jgi:aspartokinase/homoserine dehydrogenase 1
MKVLKFGGTSVKSAKNIHKVIATIKDVSKEQQCIVVVSAVGGITDKLMDAANKAVEKLPTYKNAFESIRKQHLTIIDGLIDSNAKKTVVKETVLEQFDHLEQLLDGLFLINELSPKTTDKLLSFGELFSSFIIAETLKYKGLDAVLKNSQELLVTDNNHTNAAILSNETEASIKGYFANSNSKITILPGFISKSIDGEITTLGRGGSDYTAAIIAAALEVEELQIWTDVSGMYTTNPKLVKQAKPIEKLSYQEAVELSHFGAKVLYPPTVQPVLDKDIPIIIKNTMAPKEVGTQISNVTSNGTNLAVKGISNIDDIALLTLQGNGMVGIPGFSKRLFETVTRKNKCHFNHTGILRAFHLHRHSRKRRQ